MAIALTAGATSVRSAEPVTVANFVRAESDHMFVESEPARFGLTEDEVGTRFALVTVRTFYDAGDPDDLAKARKALAILGFDSTYAFGSKEDVRPIDHLAGTAAGWGGLPHKAAHYEMGSVEPNDGKPSSAAPNEDGSYTIRFSGCEGGQVNCIPITPGWNYAIRMHQPREEILNGSWTFAEIAPAS
jgi:hypothetical protein